VCHQFVCLLIERAIPDDQQLEALGGPRTKGQEGVEAGAQVLDPAASAHGDRQVEGKTARTGRRPLVAELSLDQFRGASSLDQFAERVAVQHRTCWQRLQEEGDRPVELAQKEPHPGLFEGEAQRGERFGDLKVQHHIGHSRSTGEQLNESEEIVSNVLCS
jgi:hypothetical protein